MRDTWPLLKTTDFPAVNRNALEILQVNLGYLCNQSCLHCHVAAGPTRKELMQQENIQHILEVLRRQSVHTLDLTGGAPEMNPMFKQLVLAARELGVTVIDRCNLTILQEPGYEDLADFLADNEVQIVASLPCYLEDNVNQQRGKGVFSRSIQGLQQLNKLGFGKPVSDLSLSLVYNPQGANLPPAQLELEADYMMYLELDRLNEAARAGNEGVKKFCNACFTGDYPTGDITPEVLQAIGGERSSNQGCLEFSSKA